MDAFADDPPIEQDIQPLLTDRDETVAIAESCTGGLIGSLLTNVSGASAYFDRSIVTYSYAAKQTALAVPRERLDRDGAVSSSVAKAMATGVRDVSTTTWGVATTGVAGPTGGSPEKPVGTAYIGLSYAGEWGSSESYTTASHHKFEGSRIEIKEQIARTALSKLFEAIKQQ
jgi:nicotinamide-nucleotide amidase